MSFHKKNNNYVFSFNGEEIYQSKKVALILSPSQKGFLLKKHGPPDSVREWQLATIKEDPKMSQEFIYVEMEDVPVEELNNILSTNSLPKQILNKAKEAMH